MKRAALLLVAFILCAPPAHAQTDPLLYIDVAQKKVDVTTGFEGAEITVFGMIKQQGDLAIILTGPEKRVVLRRKEPVNGMWMNRGSMDFRRVPLFYDYAVSRVETQIADVATLRNLNIGLNYIKFDADTKEGQKQIADYQEALIRTEQTKGNFPLEPKAISFTGSQLFRANFYVPASVPMGQYKVAAILLSDGKVIARQDMPIDVGPKGVAALILLYATDYSFAYGISGLLFAISAGLLGFFLTRRDRV